MGRVADKVAVITGGASGIGAAAAEKLLGEGAYVVLGDIQEQAGADMVAVLGDRCRFKLCDVTQEDQVEALIQSAVDEFGKIDVMFNSSLHGGDGLKQFAQGADYLIVDTWHSQHAATGSIDQVVPPEEQIRPDTGGRGCRRYITKLKQVLERDNN